MESSSVVRGPAYIGKNTVVGPNTYVGPYTSIGDNCRLVDVEIENSVVMDNVVLMDVGGRLVDSLIGSNTRVERRKGKPRGIRLVVGEHTIVEW